MFILLKCLFNFSAQSVNNVVNTCNIESSKEVNITLTSAENCSIPFTYEGQLYYNCIQHVTNITQSDQYACLVANRTWAICNTSTGRRL